MSDSDYNSYDDNDSENEILQDAFAKGELKPGLNVQIAERRVYANNVAALKRKLLDMENRLGWIERLDIINKPAPLAPELAVQMADEESRVSARSRNGGLDNTVFLDEFKRESLFHRQAQSAALEGLSRLQAMHLQITRPDDYFAEMVKSDEHMQKVRTLLVKKKATTERVEKVRKIREMKKLNKQIQCENKVRKINEKREMMEEVKKFRKGQRKDLDFLELNKGGYNKSSQNKSSQKKSKNTKSIMKRNHRDKKFGFGGKKRGMKANTKKSTENF